MGGGNAPPADDQNNGGAADGQKYKYDAMAKPGALAKVEIADFTLQPDIEGEKEVQDKFKKLAEGFSELTMNLAGAIKKQNKSLTWAVGDKLAIIHKDVEKAVGEVQAIAHGKRVEIITHVNAQGVKAQEAINALQNGWTNLDDKRKEDEEKRKSDLEKAKKEQDKKDKEVDDKLKEHHGDIANNTQNIGNHKGRLDSHEAKHVKAHHQRELLKTALDADLNGGYGTEYLKGTSRDKLKDWDPQNPRKTTAQEQADGRRRCLPASYASMRPSEQALTRRRLMNRPNSHVVVLEQLLGEINRLNATN